nr:MAG TPA: hypothetical protein [Siphovirus LN-2020-2]
MTRIAFALVGLTVTFAAKLFISKMLEAEVEKALDKKVAEQNAPAN